MDQYKGWKERSIVVVLSVVLSLLSVGVMSYVSMATVMGPWVAPVLVLVAMVVLLPLLQKNIVKESVAGVVAAGSVGGIIAVALGFSFPALYFLRQDFFNALMAKPLTFSLLITALVALAGAFGFIISYFIKDYLLMRQDVTFPIGLLVYHVLYGENRRLSFIKMLSGMSFSMMYNGWLVRFGSMLTMFSSSVFHMGPLLFSIGFIAGHVTAVPLLIGMLSRIFVLDVIRSEFFSIISEYSFIVAFSLGLVLSAAAMGIVSLAKKFVVAVRRYKQFQVGDFVVLLNINRFAVSVLALIIVLCCAFFVFCKFTIWEQVYVLVFTAFASFYMAFVAGVIGLAEIGRFATFVMLPALYMFDINYFQAVIIATFVSICSAVTVDLLFGYKLAQLADISYQKMVKYQLSGFFIAVASIGIIFWAYAQYFGLGSPALFAQEAQGLNLLIQLHMFEYSVVLCGIVYGLILQWFGVGPLLVFGGLVMPFYMASWFVVAGACSYFVKDKESLYPFWFGVYAFHTLWLIAYAIYTYAH